MGSIPVFEAECVETHTPLEDNHVPADAITKNVVTTAPAKKRGRRGNDSVSPLTPYAFRVADKPSDQDVYLA